MIVLDTNVISESWKSEPIPQVLHWLDAQTIETLYLSAVTVAELRYGIAAMPTGKRKTLYHNHLEQQVLPLFAERVLPFGLHVTQAYAALMAQARVQGKAISKEDGYIAATAATHGFVVATRNVHPFQAAGLPVINPWETTA